jgi:Tfp pilus assembly protein PilX
MKLYKNKNKLIDKKGSALAYALVMMAVVSIILVSLLQYISAQLRFSFYRGEREEAFQITEAGVYFYRWYLAHEISGKTAQQIKTFWQSGNPYGVATPYEAEFFDPEGGAIGKYRIQVTPPETDSTIVIVKVTGWTYKEPNTKRIVQARFRRPSWSEYSIAANDVMRFGAGTEVYGKIHSNDGIRFDGVAHNIVSSAMDKYDDPDHGGGVEFGVHTHVNAPPSSGINDAQRPNEAPPNAVPNRVDVFRAGRQFPVPTIDFNGVISDLNNMKTESKISGHGLYFDTTGSGRSVMLKNNGTFDMCTVNSYGSASYSITNYAGIITGATKHPSDNGKVCTTNDCCAVSTCANITGNGNGKCVSLTNHVIPNKGIIFVENNVWVEGTIDNARVAVVAANLLGGTKSNIYIGNNNLLYTNFDGKDIIGLVAQKDISVIRDSQNDLTVDAALLAQSGRVGRDYYSHSYDKNSITVNGSIVTNLRYGFAYTDGTGYDTRILNFDNNLLYFPPPYFPTGTEYSIDLWDEL